MDLGTLRRIIQQESPIRLEVGTVTAADPRGTRTVSVRLSGGRTCSRTRTCVDGLEPGDQVLVARMMQLDRVVVIGQLLDDVNPVLARRGVLAPPDNLTVDPVPAGIVVRWDTYPGEDICWEVRYNTSASDTGATDVLVTRGSYYTHYVVDASGDMDTAATYHFRVRAIRWMGANNVMYSAWSAWSNATSGGHNLREIVELEFEDAIELTISSGAVTRTQVYHTIDTESDASTDDLDTINGGTEGDLLVIRPASDSRTVVVKHNTGNIWLTGKADILLDDLKDHVALIHSTAGYWCDISGGAGGGGGSSTFTGLTDTPGDYTGHKRELLAVTDAEAALNFIAATGWLSTGDHSVGDASDIRWQPDCVVLLRDGVVTEYDDPDDAFADADTAGDVILIPPGEWTLTTGYSLTDVSIVGLGGGPGDCVLKSTMSSSTTLLDMNGSCTLFNFTIDWQIASSSGTTHYALKLGVSCQTYFVNIDLEIASGSSHAQGMQTTGITRQCVVHVTTDSGNSTGIDAAGNEVMQDCEGVATTDSGIAKGLMANDIPEKLPVKDCVGYGKTTGTGTAYGLFFGGFPISEVHIGDSWFTGDTYDVGGIKSEAHFNSVKYETTNLTDGATIVHEAGDRAGKGRADTITGQWVFEALAGLAFKDATELTIAGGVITRTQVYHKVDTESDAATDDLDTINGGSTGDLLVLCPADGARTVVVKHNTGNIWLMGKSDVSLDDTNDHLALVYDGSKWCDTGGGGGGGGVTDHGALSGLEDDDHTQYGALAQNETVAGQWTFDRTSGPTDIHRVEDTAAAAVTEILRLVHELSSGTAAAGMGARVLLQQEDSASNVDDLAAIEALWDDAASGSEDSAFAWLLREGGAALARYMKLTNTALLCQNTQELNIGSTTDAEKWGHVYLAQYKDVFPDDGTHAKEGIWRRFVNKLGLSSYTHHRGTGTGVPSGTSVTSTPSNLWTSWKANYYGWLYNTYYAQYPDHASLPAGLTVASGDPLSSPTVLTARVHTTGSSEFGLWTDNFDSNRSYAVDDYIYRYDVYAYGNGPETLLYTQTSTSKCTAAGVGGAATFAAWVRHAKSGPYGPFCPCGDGVVIRLRANHNSTATVYPYVIGEQGATSGLGASQTLYDDAWPGSSSYAARRIGTFHRLQGYAWASWDWYYLE